MNNILVTRSSMPSFEEYCEEIKDIWDSHWLTNMGVKHKKLQTELENYLGIPHVALYTNGHLALENAIAALNLPKGGEVITTPFTFASTTHAIVRNGLVPVFCDIKEDDYTIDTQKLENLMETLYDSLGVKEKQTISHYYLLQTDAVSLMNRDDVSGISTRLGFMTDLEEHIRIVSGECYSEDGLTPDGAIEVVVSQACMVSQKLLVGETLAFDRVYDADGEPIRI